MLIYAASVITVSTILYTISALATSTTPSAVVSTIPATPTPIPYECISLILIIRHINYGSIVMSHISHNRIIS